MSSPRVVESGEFLYVGGITPAARGSVPVETRSVLEQLRSALADAGSSLDGVVSVLVFLRAASDFQAMNDAYRAFWASDFPTRTTIVCELPTPGVMVEMSAVAVRTGAERVVVHPRDWVASPSPYSYAMKSADTVFLSGLVSRTGRDNTSVAGSVGEQTKVILDNAGELLRAAGLSHGDGRQRHHEHQQNRPATNEPDRDQCIKDQAQQRVRNPEQRRARASEQYPAASILQLTDVWPGQPSREHAVMAV